MHLLLSLQALAATTTAQISTTQKTLQSAPFNLLVLSHNRTLNGSLLAACHEGAGIESLCALPKPQTYSSEGYEFQLNTTAYICTYANSSTLPCDKPPHTSIGQPGILTWNEHYTGPSNTPGSVSQSMQLVPQGPSSNLAFPIIFFPEEGALQVTEVAFDDSGLMNMQDSLDPRKATQAPDESTVKAYYRWFVCEGYWEYYSYNHLVWVYGSGDPWDTDCEEVKVQRVFVDLE